jgi:hypothetical protein
MARTIIASLLAALLLAALPGSATAAPAPPSREGDVRFVKGAGPDFDRYSSDPLYAPWMQQHFWRVQTYSPYWDSILPRYSDAWVYRDLYAIYVGSELANEHPEWILRDARGQPVYIPWGCSGGSCPQYAADVGNPAFRSHWIAEQVATVAKGYKGLFIDDVNMEFRVGDGSGNFVPPRDPRTGREMTYEDWRRYVAEFTEQIRGALRGTEIVHNAIWFAASPECDCDPYVRRQLRSADYINVERGVNDAGLRGGAGPWSLRTLLDYIDRRHEDGQGVLLNAYGVDSDRGREYGLANYFLISAGMDGIGSHPGTSPDDWWGGYGASLGRALGRRYEWEGMLRRDFEGGVVLVNEPDSPTRVANLGFPASRLDGTQTTQLRLGGAEGAVLRTEGRPPRPGGSVSPPDARKPVSARSRALSVGLRVRALRRRNRRRSVVAMTGRVHGAGGGAVEVAIERRSGRGWKHRCEVRASVRANGRFTARVRRLLRGRYRVRALYRDESGRATASRYRRLALRH